VTLTFWYDVHSPWCYFAAHRVGDLARKHGYELAWRPLHLPRLQVAIDGRKPMEANAAFVSWFKQDMADWAELLGLPFAPHVKYPLRNSRALRACLYAADLSRGEDFARLVLRKYWSEQGDISDLDQLASWGEACDLAGTAIRAAATSEEFKHRIDLNTNEAIARGVFGVPTIDTGAKLYWGNDRLELLDTHLSIQGGGGKR
jgi:2-hydroxychromene-2-carboxylate isomerase